MKKSTFLILAAIAAAGTMFFECSSTYSSEAVRKAELGTLSETQQPKTALSEAITNDNE